MSLLENLNISSTFSLKKNLQLAVLFAFCSFIFSSLKAQEVKVEVDTMNIRIGEQFKYQISVNDTSNVIIPELKNLSGLEIVEDLPTDTVEKNLIKKYMLTGFDSGAYYIPSQQVFIRNRAYITDSILINVATVAIDTTKQKMFPIKSIQGEPWIFDDLKPYIIWIVLGLLLIGALIYYIKTRKKEDTEEKEVVPVLAAYEEALQKLAQLDEKLLWQNNKVKQYYIELTDIIRNYLGRDIEIPTLELTTSEIVDLVETQNKSRKLGLTKETLSDIEKLLKNADLVKFAKSKPVSFEIEIDRKTAEKIITNIKPKVEEYREAIQEEQGTVIQETSATTAVGSNEQKPTEKKTSRKKFSTKKIIIATIIVVVFATVAFVSYKVVSVFSSMSTSEMVQKEWITKTYGSNASMTIEAPVELKEDAQPELPEEIKNLVLSMENYSYGNIGRTLEIGVLTSSYQPSVDTSLDGAVRGALDEMKKQPGVSNFTENIVAYDKLGVPGADISGTYTERGSERDYRGIILAKGNKLWTIIIGWSLDDESGETIANRIIDSIKIDANVE